MKEEKAHILYVDDEPDNLTVFKSTFRRFYKIHTANSALEGIEILKENPQIEVIITDQRMPETTGVEFLEKILPEYPHSVRMILTGFSDIEAIIDSINKGQVYRYITKPWNPEELQITIDKAIQARRSNNSQANLSSDITEQLQKFESEISQLKEELYTKNLEINTNLNYSRKIQEVLLPDAALLASNLQESFIFNRPQNVVSGDFYWFIPLANKILIGVADCPGHGVSGGLLSTITHSLLQEIINPDDLASPDLILASLDQNIRKMLKQDETDLQDNIAISLCVIDKTARTLEFAGAKSPLVYVENHQLHEIDGNRRAAGGILKLNESERIFRKHLINLHPEQVFYLFTDGYQNQFGGPDHKKFRREAFRDLLLEIHREPLKDQKELLKDRLNEWMQNEIQVDDILIFGFKI